MWRRTKTSGCARGFDGVDIGGISSAPCCWREGGSKEATAEPRKSATDLPGFEVGAEKPSRRALISLQKRVREGRNGHCSRACRSDARNRRDVALDGGARESLARFVGRSRSVLSFSYARPGYSSFRNPPRRRTCTAIAIPPLAGRRVTCRQRPLRESRAHRRGECNFSFDYFRQQKSRGEQERAAHFRKQRQQKSRGERERAAHFRQRKLPPHRSGLSCALVQGNLSGHPLTKSRRAPHGTRRRWRRTPGRSQPEAREARAGAQAARNRPA